MIAAVGALLQLAGVLLLAAFLLLVRRYADVRGYFGPWSWGWAAYAIALVAIVLRYFVAPGFPAPIQPFVEWVCDALYLPAKIALFVALAVGAARFAGRSWRLGPTVIAGTVYATLARALAPDLNTIMRWQAPVAVAASATAAWHLLAAPRRRRTVGSVVTGGTCVGLAMLWSLYFYVFQFGERAPGALALVMQYNSFLDLLVSMLLGFGMVVLVLEDAKRRADTAHAELTRAHEALRRSAVHDPLTGALNRAAFHDLAASGASQDGGAVVLVDLDNLKSVNDALGHAAGDRLLVHFASTLLVGLPIGMRVYRWGGDEFVVVAPGARADDAEHAVTALVTGAARIELAGERVALAASVGAAEYRGASELQRAIAHADASMYAEKMRRKGTPAFGVGAIVG